MGDIDIIHYKTYLIFVNQIIVITLSDHYKPSGTGAVCPQRLHLSRHGDPDRKKH